MPKAAKKQRVLRAEHDDDKEKLLEEAVFGLEAAPSSYFDAVEETVAEDAPVQQDLFFEDVDGDQAESQSDDGEPVWIEAGQQGGHAGPASHERGPSEGVGRRPVWTDDDAATVTAFLDRNARTRKLHAGSQRTLKGDQYESALRKKHVELNSRTRWAVKRPAEAPPQAGEDGGAEADDSTLLSVPASCTVHRASQEHMLPPGQLEISRMKDANQHRPSDAVVQAVRFHPSGQVLLTGGLDKKLRLFQVDGVRNSLLQEVFLADMPIMEAAFLPESSAGASAGSSSVIAVGRRPFAYLYDMHTSRTERLVAPKNMDAKSLERLAVAPSRSQAPGGDPLVAFAGDGGRIPLLSVRSRQWVASLKMSGNVRALAFSHDGRELYSTGDSGIVHVWDLRTRRCRFAFTDVGSAGDASSLAVSDDGRYIASGSRSGVVNLYQRADVEASAAQAASGAALSCHVAVAPLRGYMNLLTDADTLGFSPDSQMLAMASRMKRDALRVVHLPTLGVFSNWPTSRSPLGYVHALDFSPHCGFLSVGNAKGRALLYRLHHYQRM